MRRAALVCALLTVAPLAWAQMPDLRTMSGKPLPVADLPAGTVTVRVARQMPANAVAGVEVTAEINNKGNVSQNTVKTGPDGRATFEGLPAGARFKAAVTVDGEALGTEPFDVPAVGGTRIMVIAGLADAPPAPAENPHGGGGSADNFRMGAQTGTVEPAGDLPKGTLEIDVLDAAGNAMPGKTVIIGEVQLAAAEGQPQVKQHQAITNERGRARFENLTVGEAAGYAAVTEHEGMRVSTTPFRMVAQSGMRGQIRALGRTSSTANLRVDSRSQFAFDLGEDAVAVVVDLVFRNVGTEIYDPGEEGLIIPIDSRFVSIQELSGGLKVESTAKGARVKTVIPPDSAAAFATRARFVYFVMSNNETSLEIVQPMPFGMEDPFLVVREKTGIKLRAEGLKALKDAQDGDGQTVKLFSMPAIAPGGNLRVTVDNLPTRPTGGHTLAAILVGLLVAAALVFSRTPADKAKAGLARDALVDKREKLFAELVEIERERKQASADAGLEMRRRDVVAKLEAVYKELGTLDRAA